MYMLFPVFGHQVIDRPHQRSSPEVSFPSKNPAAHAMSSRVGVAVGLGVFVHSPVGFHVPFLIAAALVRLYSE